MKWKMVAVNFSLVVCLVVWGAGCSKQEGSPAPTSQAQEPAVVVQPVPNVTELKSEDIKVGTGAVAEPGKQVTVDYTGWLANGTKFDSSKDHGQPFKFMLGTGAVIQGWDQGVAGMKVGGVRKLTVPPSLGYGAAGAGDVIPPNATLVFEVELLNVE